ncbi:ParB/RepB/Spo0J family partition protein [Marinivivus vitaminiproducens]|uniref:ParB/RepB/Spo0J family partition protein n=1 Tax=Marinivivus vitaminiproducens TaxID=3035935 RepID=UPI00279B6111|nr:ParB/RepB/Spo0J family partition protein [Geminicoccaceae bacterium SCSIO 64248]
MAGKKITLASARDIPFDKLELSQANVRRVKDGLSIETLADSIARRGLIQSLHVRPVLDEDGQETGRFEVPAGGRRYRALELLVKAKRLNKTAPVPCVVSGADDPILIDELSLAENIERAPLHPLDQFRAFQAMREKGMTEEAIAAAFVVSAQVVKQRLRLASVAPALLEVYAEDGMTLEQVMAFSIAESHERQEQVWTTIRNAWSSDPGTIRRLLTETAVPAGDKRVRLVGLDVYVAEGGQVMRDLFEDDEGGWLQDPVLLERLVATRLKTAADAIAAEGWKWVQTSHSLPYGFDHGLRRLQGRVIERSAEAETTLEALETERDTLAETYGHLDDLPENIYQKLEDLDAGIADLSRPIYRYQPDEMTIAGVFLAIGAEGGLLIHRGYVRPEDEPPAAPEEPAPTSTGDASLGADASVLVEPDADAIEPASVPADPSEAPADPTAPRVVLSIGSQAAPPATDELDEAIKPLSERLVTELTAHRTLALRDAVAGDPRVALTLLLHTLVGQHILRRFGREGCLEARVNHVFFPAQADDLAESPSAQAVNARQAAWEGEIPSEESALWHWLEALDDDRRMTLLAHCVSYGVNALSERPNPHSASGISAHGLQARLAQADRVARATGLAMADVGWRPTVANYLGRVSKARILAAVREGAGERAAELIEPLKKDEMAREAERLLADTGWLPEPLRPLEADAASDEAEDDELPAFLSGDDETGDEDARVVEDRLAAAGDEA